MTVRTENVHRKVLKKDRYNFKTATEEFDFLLKTLFLPPPPKKATGNFKTAFDSQLYHKPKENSSARSCIQDACGQDTYCESFLIQNNSVYSRVDGPGKTPSQARVTPERKSSSSSRKNTLSSPTGHARPHGEVLNTPLKAVIHCKME